MFFYNIFHFVLPSFMFYKFKVTTTKAFEKSKLAKLLNHSQLKFKPSFPATSIFT